LNRLGEFSIRFIPRLFGILPILDADHEFLSGGAEEKVGAFRDLIATSANDRRKAFI
jgi:hypothetical protein